MSLNRSHIIRILIPLLPLAAVGCDRATPEPGPAAPAAPPRLSASTVSATPASGKPVESAPKTPTGESTAKAGLPSPEPSARAVEAAELMRDPKWVDNRFEFYRKWASEDPKAALEHAQKNNPAGSTQSVGSVLESWIGKDRNAALGWLDAQPENAERSIWLNHLLETAAPDQLQDLAARAVKGLNTPSGAPALALAVKRLFLSKEDPGAGLEDWLETSFPEASDRTTALKTVMRDWSQENEEAASKWLNKVPKEAPWRDDAIAILVQQIRVTDTSSAKIWAGTIQDKTKREALLGDLDTVPAK